MTTFTDGNVVTTAQVSPNDLIERDPSNGAQLVDWGYPNGGFSISGGRGNFLAQRSGDGAIYFTGNATGDGGKISVIGPDGSDLGIYVDPAAAEVANGVGGSRMGIKFDDTGRLYIFYSNGLSHVYVLRYDAAGAFDAFFDLTFTLSAEPIVDKAPSDNPSLPGTITNYHPSGIDIDSTGRYLYTTADKGLLNTNVLYHRNIYVFDLAGGPSASIWKSYGFYQAPSSVSYQPSPAHGFISSAYALAVDPVTGNLATYEMERTATFITVGAITSERDNFDFYFRVYDSSATLLSSLHIASTSEPLNAGGAPNGTNAPLYLPGSSIASPMRWAPDGSNLFYWLADTGTTAIYLTDQSGIISTNLGTGTSAGQRTYPLIVYASGATPSLAYVGGLERDNSPGTNAWRHVGF